MSQLSFLIFQGLSLHILFLFLEIWKFSVQLCSCSNIIGFFYVLCSTNFTWLWGNFLKPYPALICILYAKSHKLPVSARWLHTKAFCSFVAIVSMVQCRTCNNYESLSYRLQQLESAMVGGEQASNEELKQKRKKKLKHVEERKLRLAGWWCLFVLFVCFVCLFQYPKCYNFKLLNFIAPCRTFQTKIAYYLFVKN